MTLAAVNPWTKMMITTLFQAVLSTGALFNNVPVTITSNITDKTICYNQSMQLTCHAYSVNVNQYNWTSTVLKQAIETVSITVVATHDPVEYKCVVTDINGESGYSGVNISSNASVPELRAVTFYPEIAVFADSYVNLTVQITSNISLATFSIWSKINGNLPKSCHITSYSRDGNNFTTLIIDKASYYFDGGLYYLNSSNYCGSSSISVLIKMLRKDAGCYPDGDPVPLLSGTNNQTTVEEELITFSCSFKGNYIPLNYAVSWIIKLQSDTTIKVKDDSNDPDYNVDTMKNCPFTNSSCCRFTTELSIHATLPLNNAMITCNAKFVGSLKPTSSTSYLMVIERPILTAGPANATSVKEHDSVHFECHFNGSLIPYLALCGWLKDGKDISNRDKSPSTEPGSENHLICDLTINSASAADVGTYSCYCYYNMSFRKQLHFQNIASQYGEAELQLKTTNDNHFYLYSWRNIGLFIAFIIITIIVLSILSFIIYCVVRRYRNRRRRVNTVQYINVETESNDEDNSTDEESIRSMSAISQPEGPTEYQPTDDNNMLRPDSVGVPVQREGDGHTATTNITSLPHSITVLDDNSAACMSRQSEQTCENNRATKRSDK